MKVALVAVALGIAVLISGVARAQTRDPATADALFREARALMKQGDYGSACPKLADSQRLDPAPGTAINLGDCLEKLGKLADALQAHREALDMLQPGDKRIDPLKAQIASIERRAPKLTITLAPGSPAGTAVSRDGVLLGAGALDTPLPVNVGAHEVVVTAPGFSERRFATSLVEGEGKSLEVRVGERTAPPAPETPALSPPRVPSSDAAPRHRDTVPGGETQRTLGWVLTGVGALGLAVGAIELVRWQDADQRVNDQCRVNSAGALACDDPAKARQDQSDARRDATISNLSFALGGAAVVGGVVLLLTAPETRTTGVRIRAGVARGAASLAAEGTW